MIIQKFTVNQYPIQTLLTWIDANEISIPEIQRPFVWPATKVRDFIDSLYKGYPVGYIIIWQNPTVKLKEGILSPGRKILIDGQQRLIALMTAVKGLEITDKDFNKKRIKIAFDPLEESFEVCNPALERDKSKIPDISVLFKHDVNILEILDDYCAKNKDVKREQVFRSLESLRKIVNIPIGVIELNHDLEIDEVTEIFIRINSAGIRLSQADFAMAKIAADENYGGNLLRKAIDYFSHFALKGNSVETILKNDKDFASSDFYQKMSWLKNYNQDLYKPNYADILRVSFTYKFNRGKLRDLVALLSGRDFETRQYEEEISRRSFNLLKEGFLSFINENNFKNFVMIIRSAGFIDKSMIISRNALNFAYVLFLKLKENRYPYSTIEQLVRKWFAFTQLTSRYTASSESTFDQDIKNINDNPIEYIENVIKSELSDAFWNMGLPMKLKTSSTNSPEFKIFLAAQVKMRNKGFLSRDITVEDLIKIKGDYHHIFPKDYLKKIGFTSISDFNQVANLVVAQSEINIAISNKAPKVYFLELKEQCLSKQPKYGGIVDLDELKSNLYEHCIPLEFFENPSDDYLRFIEARRKLMAEKIKEYFSIL